MIATDMSLDIATLRAAYLSRSITPEEVIELVLTRIDQADEHHAWIHRLPRATLLAYAACLRDSDPAALPLYGVPFAIKDNIDLAGVPTTAACPDYAYTPQQSAAVVQQLIDAGAIPIGKTNLDQFATGLVGTRSPYGAARNSFDPAYIAGGSSSGSAIAVALGQVSFALGTDTAGSGRVPAAFNNLIGMKPTRGLLSTRGVVPACRSLDCVSIFALTAEDAAQVLKVTAQFDTADPFARRNERPRLGAGGIPATQFRFGMPQPAQLAWFGNTEYPALFTAAVARMEALGGVRVEIDFAPFLEAARLLYEGPWVAERYVAIAEFIGKNPQALYPITRQIIEKSRTLSAVDTFRGQYRLEELRRAGEAVWVMVDVIVTPTAGNHYRLDDVTADPIQLNSNLGYYTNFANLLDLSAVAVPSGFQANGLPFGITLLAPAFYDRALLQLAGALHHAAEINLGTGAMPVPAPAEVFVDDNFHLAVCGAHMSGLALNHQLTSRGGQLLLRTQTAGCYRLYLLPGGPPQRPGLVRVNESGAAIELEVWALPAAAVGDFVAAIPTPLGIGRVELADGSNVAGFVCEAYAAQEARDITAYLGWRNFLKICE